MRKPALVLSVLAAVVAVGPVAASAHAPTAASSAALVDPPLVGSPNVHLLTTFPETRAISGEFSHTGAFFYVSGLDSISVFDISKPEAPVLKGVLPNFGFENEAMTYGERKGADGKLQRFVLFGNDLVDVTTDSRGVNRGGAGGGDVLVVDVTDPTNPHVRSRTPIRDRNMPVPPGAVTTSTHTAQCVTVSCEFAYVAGNAGKFSIVDLRDLDNPKELKTVPSPAAAPTAIFTRGAGHYWDVETDAGLAWHTGSGGTAVFDIHDPVNPVLIEGTNADGTKTPYNDFIHHNSMRPNARAFKAGAAPDLRDGNVALITEEDYTNDGDEAVCSNAGTFQTWSVPSLDGAAYRARNPEGKVNLGSMAPLDIINPPLEFGGGLSTPIGGFCSAHWFDYHQTGIVAQGYYQEGLRLIDVRNPRDLKQYGYFTGGASEVWDAYFVPERDAKGVVVPGRKTDIVYSVDLGRGLDVFKVDLPKEEIRPNEVVAGDRNGDAPGMGGVVVPPAPASPKVTCTSRRVFTIRLKEPRKGRGRLTSARVTVSGKKAKVTRKGGRLTARVDLRGKARSSYTVRITAKTSRGKTVRETRRYRTCEPS